METLIIVGMIALSVFFGIKLDNNEKKMDKQQTLLLQQDRKIDAQGNIILSQRAELQKQKDTLEAELKAQKEFDQFSYEVLEGQQEAIGNLEAKRVVEIDARTGQILH